MINLLLLARVSKKIGINQAVYHVLENIIGRNQIIPRFISWKDYLRELNPDDGGSCLCKNEIIPKEEQVNLEIIIPVYNTEQYVAECLESALNQKTKYSYRVIIVNDGSTDGSPDIVNRYAHDTRVHIIHQENRGFSGARNRALEKIGGDYIMFLDSDDRLPDDAIEKLLNKAYEDNYDIVGGGYVRFDDKNYKLKVIPKPRQLYGLACTKVYKSWLWESKRFPERYWFEDTINAMILFDVTQKKTSIQDVVYEYRINRNGISFTSRGIPKVIDTLWITIRLMKDRKIIGMPFDDKIQNQLLYQFKINTIRIFSLGDKQANIANFLGSCELYFTYFNKKCLISENRQIEDAIIRKDYRQFLLACLLL